MNYYIGIDAGGTKSKCVLTDENFKVLAEETNGNGAFLIYGIEEVSKRFHQTISNCLAKAELTYNDLTAIVMGCAGAGGEENANKFRNGFIKYSLSQGVNYKNVLVKSDAIIALEGAFSGKAGAILISGTGSILLGKDEENNLIRVGGAGRLVGDEGSGYKIGQNAINAVYKYYDGIRQTSE